MASNELLITLYSYLCQHAKENGKIPSITEMSDELGISVATLREQLEVTRALGIIESRPGKEFVYCRIHLNLQLSNL